jgi:hypothetical protein
MLAGTGAPPPALLPSLTPLSHHAMPLSHHSSVSVSIVLAMMFFVSHNVPENKPSVPDTAQVGEVWRLLPLLGWTAGWGERAPLLLPSLRPHTCPVPPLLPATSPGAAG